MSYEVLDNIVAMADEIRAGADDSDRLGRLTDDMAAGLRQSGIIRLLQRKKYNGYEAHPREFAETVMKTASIYGSAGWVGGIVGVHPWQLAFADPRCRTKCWARIPIPGRHPRTCPGASRFPSTAGTG